MHYYSRLWLFFLHVFQSPVERAAVYEMLNLLVRLKPANYNLVKKLLTLLAYKKLRVQWVKITTSDFFNVTESLLNEW